MTSTTRRIGLSLGADICWPIAYEHIVNQLGLDVAVDRVPIEPFDLEQPIDYDVVIDRLTHWYGVRREWIKKALLLDDVYVFNNPWSVQSMEKQTTYCAMMRLGLHVPKTWLIPPKSYKDVPDLERTLQSYAKLFDLPAIGERIGYPIFMKPYDGGGWVGVAKADDGEELAQAYDESGNLVMHLQRGIVPHDAFVRCIGLGPQVRYVRYAPSAPLHDRYTIDFDFLEPDDVKELEDITLTINAFFGWDFNSCESLRQDGTWYPIDFANPCPDSQVTSLHFHWPWLIKAKIRWSLFCAMTKRTMRLNLSWGEFFEVDPELPYRERLTAYAKIARKRFDADAFESFCKNELADLDAIAWDWFGTEDCHNAIRAKVTALYPEDEHDEFSELFWRRVQLWRERERDSNQPRKTR
ncbi:MAG: hypothetical protein H6832_15215 [Planctomycetes bacterium]|nr:hypothetical protein [Planctomycetota bacterium]